MQKTFAILNGTRRIFAKMIFYFNSNGEPLGSIIGRVFCGSVNAESTYFVCPVNSDALVSMSYLLPNGDISHKIPMQSLGENSGIGIELEDEVIYNVWKADTPFFATKTSGNVMVQFFISSDNGAIVSTAGSVFSVEEGVMPKELNDDASYDEIATIISGLNTIVKKANSALTSAFVSDTSAIVNGNQLVVGKFNEEDAAASFIAGCGTSEDDRQNGFYITSDGYARTSKMPLADNDVVNKAYVDANSIGDGNRVISTQVDNIVLKDVINKQFYYVNNVNLLSLIPNDGTQAGDYFYIMFNSGSVPTMFVKPQEGNMVMEEIVPMANQVVEISGVWNGSKWIVLSRQTAV